MEHRLINAFMKLLAKSGSGPLIKDLIQEVDENGNPKIWSPAEIEKAIRYVNLQIENFGTTQAVTVVETLFKKYNLRPEQFLTDHEPQPETSNIQGLQ